MEEISNALFGKLPVLQSPIIVNSNINNNKYNTSSSSSSSSVSNNNEINDYKFCNDQQSIVADTFKHITTFSCGQELQKDNQVKEKLSNVITMLHNAMIGGDNFLQKYETNKQKSKSKIDGDKSDDEFKYLSLKDARNIASTIMGCDVNKWNREEERRLCFELSLIRLYTSHPGCQHLFIHTANELLQSYPEFEAIQYETDEMDKLIMFRNYMKVACCTMQAHNNKGHLLDLVTRLCEGPPELIKYITGSGEKPTTRRRVMIYEREGEVSKISRPERATTVRKDDYTKTAKPKKNAVHSNRFNTKSSRLLSLKDPSKLSPSIHMHDDDSPRSGFEILVDVVAQESMVLIDSIIKEQSENPPTPSINDINPPDFKHTFGVSGETFGQNLPPPSLLRLTSLGIIEKDFQSQESDPITIDKGLSLGGTTNIPFSGFNSNESFSPRMFGLTHHQTSLG